MLRDRALELQKQNATMMAVVKDLEKECNDLEGNDDEQSKTDLAGLVQEIEEKQASLKEVILHIPRISSMQRKPIINVK